MDDLIRRLQERIRRAPAVENDALCVYTNERGGILPPRPPEPPVTLAVVEEVERGLGFRLPTPVRRLYTEVANGSWGPCWGIQRLRSPPGTDFTRWWEVPMSVEAWFRLEQHEQCAGHPVRYWPEPSIRFCEAGCNISYRVDCSSDEGRVFSDDPNGWDPAAAPAADDFPTVADSVAQWLSAWLEKPWPEARYP